MTTYILKNIDREGPGLIAEYLKEKGKSFQVIEPDALVDFTLPSDLEALIILGGPASANDQTEDMVHKIDIAREAMNQNLKVLGICLGMQIMTKAKEGKVVPLGKTERAFRDSEGNWNPLYLLDQGQDNPLFSNISNTIPVFHLHGETIVPNEQIQWLGQGADCQYQALSFGEKAYGFQCHLELTLDMLKAWLTEDPDLVDLDHDQIIKDYLSVEEVYRTQCFCLLDNFFNHI
ncbi:type 1 glutamine amidotransferase [Spirochaeta cellobiosiphila]|uniref:type 1 glutamine amidotransferase n=1 Tax=Spirochaeta cellobiosiphila TaxID=504483 RepID=UPI0003F845FF|nr:type 1 glutamine amidotransferase [Spirochaeta cellobiosiphila]